MKNCSICERELLDDVNYCPTCGSSTKRILVEECTLSSDRLVALIRKLIHDRTIRRIIIKNEKGQALFEISTTLEPVNSLLAPWMAALGAISGLSKRCTIIIERFET